MSPPGCGAEPGTCRPDARSLRTARGTIEQARTVQEAVANVRKHSEAAARPDRLLHIGLETMVERVRMSGGAVDVDSAPGPGTRVSFEIPLAGTHGAERA